ncbi:DUF2971 domain-containing protein [Pseudoalteromonas phenolica]|uniref:DUF2971 domain-containing protein n=1 Tax=Pseudoalteromonas phenolica TaxID=161398 RepID=UPI00110A96EE|nr:DUF2971 domain-containing protein [Pseudoalteromonas phenolica]TMO53083.1 hypothetical protein CWC21_21145 [Pseudoalteromonas phenolica]
MIKTPPDYFYHYTSVESAFYILGGDSPKSDKLILRLSSPEAMNDSKELKMFYERLEKLKATISIKRFIRKIANEVEDEFLFHVLSFTEEPDKLSQWSMYGDNGKGVALGFSRELLELDMKNALMHSDNKFSSKLAKCIYNEDEQNNVLKEIVNEANIHRVQTNEFSINRTYYSLKYSIAIALITFKCPSFKEESEHRLIRLIRKKKNNSQLRLSKINGLKFKPTNRVISTFTEFRFSPNSLTHFNLGPRCKIHDESLDLRYFLLSSGVKVDDISIKSSSSSYR